jgi:hypothetical protein
MSSFNGEDQFICPAGRDFFYESSSGQDKKSCPVTVSDTDLLKIQIIVQRVEKQILYNIS